MRLSPKGLFAIALTTSTLLDSVTSQTFLRCTPNQQLRLSNAWDDAIALASAAYGTMTWRTNEALVQKYFPGLSPDDRDMVELAFQKATNSALVKAEFVLSCGDFQIGDISSSGQPVPQTHTICQPGINAYTRRVVQQGLDVGLSTNDIAACDMLETVRIGSLMPIFTDLNRRAAFCAETDIPNLPAADIGMSRRLHFPGWTLLHEFMHTIAVASHIYAQGLQDIIPFLGAADYTYDQAAATLLDPYLAARNADSYAHFAWEAFYAQSCDGRQAQSVASTFLSEDYIDWDTMIAELGEPTLTPRAAPKAAPDNGDKLETIPAIVDRSTFVNSHPIAKRLTSHPLSKRQDVPTKLDASTVTKLKPRTRKRKGTARIVKIIQCKGGCYTVVKKPAKPGKKLGPPQKVAIKKCNANEIFIPSVLVSKTPNPKLKKSECMPVSKKAGTTPPGTNAPPKSPTPGTEKPPITPGKQNPVKAPIKPPAGMEKPPAGTEKPPAGKEKPPTTSGTKKGPVVKPGKKVTRAFYSRRAVGRDDVNV